MRSILFFGIALVVASPAYSASADFEVVNITELATTAKSHGCSHKLVRDDEQATLLVQCDEDGIVANRDLRDWFFAQDLSDSYVNQHKEKLTAQFAEFVADKLMFTYYRTSDIDQLAVVGRVIGRDDYGQPVDDIV